MFSKDRDFKVDDRLKRAIDHISNSIRKRSEELLRIFESMFDFY